MHIRCDKAKVVRVVRLAALALFAGVTLYGLSLLFRDDWREVGAYWLSRRGLLLLGFMLSACDILTDAGIWMLILRRLGVRIGVFHGTLLFLSGYAGLLMPVQLGRFFRASEVARLGFGTMAAAVKAEIILLCFAALASVAIFAGAFLYRWSLLAALAVPVVLIILGLFFVHQIFMRLPQLPRRVSLELPTGFWMRPGVIGLAFLAATGWLLNGAVLFLIFKDVSETLQLHHTIMIVTSNLFVGVATGLPGGLGISESYIGAMMYWLQTPPAHLVMAVAAFRLITFWVWIPIGWCAVLLVSLVTSPSKSA